MKKISALIIFLIILMFFGDSTFAQEKLEINYSFNETVFLTSQSSDLSVSFALGRNIIGTAVSKDKIIRVKSVNKFVVNMDEIMTNDKVNLLPKKYSLKQNYPNPFNPTTNIEYTVPFENYVTLKIFNSLGEEVSVLVDGQKSAGIYNVTWNAQNFSNGVYIYTIRSGNFSDSKKMVLLK